MEQKRHKVCPCDRPTLNVIAIPVTFNTGDPFTGEHMGTRAKKKTGAARMRQLDYAPLQVWFKREQLNKIIRAAELKGLKVAAFVRLASVARALDELQEAD